MTKIYQNPCTYHEADTVKKLSDRRETLPFNTKLVTFQLWNLSFYKTWILRPSFLKKLLALSWKTFLPNFSKNLLNENLVIGDTSLIVLRIFKCNFTALHLISLKFGTFTQSNDHFLKRKMDAKFASTNSAISCLGLIW